MIEAVFLSDDLDGNATYISHIKRRFGLSASDYDSMLRRQGGTCAVCASIDAGTRNGNFVVDHCHTHGHIRGLICNRCNIGLGNLGDTVDDVVNALAYLLNGDGRTRLAGVVRDILRNKRGDPWVIKSRTNDRHGIAYVYREGNKRKVRKRLIGTREEAENVRLAMMAKPPP